MAHTYTSTLFHVVFSTKERRALLIKEPEKLWAYIAGTARNLGYEPMAVGGTENHLHLLLRLPAHVAGGRGRAEAAPQGQFVADGWGENGTWFGWQHGYGAFSVSPSNLESGEAVCAELSRSIIGDTVSRMSLWRCW